MELTQDQKRLFEKYAPSVNKSTITAKKGSSSGTSLSSGLTDAQRSLIAANAPRVSAPVLTSKPKTVLPTLATERADELDKLNAPSVSRQQKYGLGNIDLTARPVYHYNDGTIATVESKSFGFDGKEVLLPTIDFDERGNAKKLTDAEAIERYRRTGEFLGKFDTVEQANAYAEALHKQQEAYYSPKEKETAEDTKKSPAAKLGKGIVDFVDSFLSGGGNSAWGNVFGVLTAVDEVTGTAMNKLLYRITGDKQYDKPFESPFREYAEYHNTASAETMERTTEGRGWLDLHLMQAAQGAGNMIFTSSLAGLAGGTPAAAGATFNTNAGAASLAGGKASSVATSIAAAGAKFGNGLIANSGNALISAGSAGQTYLSATEKGASQEKAFANAIGSGLLEYFSNKLFGGTPIEDPAGQQGYVTKMVDKLVTKLGKEEAMHAFFGGKIGKAASWTFDKIGEGLEEVITAIGDPLIERWTWNENADMATVDEIADAFVGGVALSLLMSGGEALINNTEKAVDKVTGAVGKKQSGTKKAAPAAEADTDSPATSAYLALDGSNKMNLKTAQQKAAIVEKAWTGELLSDSDVKALDLSNSAKRGVFNQLTGLNLDESVNKEVGTAEGRGRIAELIRTQIVDQKTAMILSLATQAAEQTQPEGNSTPAPSDAVSAAQEAVTEASEDDPGKVTLGDFALRYRQEVKSDATAEEITQAYEQFRADTGVETKAGEETITLKGITMDYAEFENFMNEFADRVGDQRIPAEQLREMFDAEFTKQSGITNKEGMNNGREEAAGVEVRGGEPQRTDGIPSAERSEGVQGGTEQARSGRAARRDRAKNLRNSVKNEGAVEQSARELGIHNGTDKPAARLVPEDLYDDEMRQLLDEFGPKGVTVHFFTGYLNIADGEGGSFNARASISPDFKEMWVKADHGDLSPAQLARHEEFHKLVGENPQLLEDAIDSIIFDHSETELGKMIGRYMQQYGWTKVSDDYVVEEICADAYAGIDVFNQRDAVGATAFTPQVQEAAGQLDTETKTPYNKYRQKPLSREARRSLKRMNKGEVLTYDELKAIPEVEEALEFERQSAGKQTIDLPNREKIQAEAKKQAEALGSYSGRDANGNAVYHGKVRRGHRVDIVMGLSGSGKSSVYTDNLSAQYQSRVSDVDDIRPLIPEYNGMNAGYVHQEAKKINDAILYDAIKRGDNLILSVVGDKAESMNRRIDSLVANGYEVYLHLNELPNEKALNRVVSRFLTEGRFVNINMVQEFGDKPTQVYLELTGQKGAENGLENGSERQNSDRAVLQDRGRSGRRTGSETRRAGSRTQGEGKPRIAGFDRYDNDVKKGDAPKLVRASSSVYDTYEKGKQAKEKVNSGKFSTETTEAEYNDALDAVVSFMKDHDIYVPQDITKNLGSIKPSDHAFDMLSEAVYSTGYDSFDNLWDDEKEELEGLLQKVQEIEQIGEKESADGYHTALHNVIQFMTEHWMGVPDAVLANESKFSPSSNVTLTLENYYMDNPAYLELSDAEDDAFQELIDTLAGYELDAAPKPKGTSNLVYEKDEGADDAYSEEEIMSMVASIEAAVNNEAAPDPTEGGLQNDREGFTPTDTPEFKAWFHDDSGELTLPDGRPKVLLSGGTRMGRTSVNFDWRDKSSPGIWATENLNIARQYTNGTTSHTGHPLMDAVFGHQTPREVKLRNAASWADAQDYVREYWHKGENGIRLVPVNKNGEIVLDMEADGYALQTNLVSQEDYNLYGAFAEGEYRTLQTFDKSEEGLEQFNRTIGDAVDELGAGVRGWMKFYGSAKKTMVVDCAGDHFDSVDRFALPREVAAYPLSWSRFGDNQNAHVNDITRRAFELGYDAVIFKEVADVGGIQTQYAFRDSEQVKSVYNSGDWSAEDKNFKFSAEKSADENSTPVEDFIRKFNEQHGDGAAEQLYRTVQELQRAQARDARKIQRQQESLQAQKSLAKKERADNLTAWLIYHKKTLRTVKQDYRAKLEDARRAKDEAVRAVTEQERELRKAEVRLTREQERARYEAKLDETKLAERMNAKKQASARLRVKENLYNSEKAERKDNDKLRRNAAKNTLRNSKLAAAKRAAIETAQGPVDTIRKSPKAKTALERSQETADKMRTLSRSAYRNFVNQATDIDRFAKRQKGGTLASTLVNIVGGSTTTTETIYKKGLVDRSGNRIGESMSDVFLCWDERGKNVDEDKQALLQDYMLHRHNVDRMSFVSNAREALESYEAENPWLAEMDAKEFAKLVAMTDAEVKKTGKQEAREKAQRYAKLLSNYSEARDKPVFPDKDGNPITADTSRAIAEQYEAENPWLRDKAEEIYQWWDQFMRVWVVGDSLSESDYEVMHNMYPHYVPTYRADKGALSAGNFVGMGGASVGTVVKKAKGGLSEIVNIEDSFANLANKAIRAARVNELYGNIIDTAMLDEDGVFADLAVFDWYDDMSEGERADLREDMKAEGYEALERAEELGLVKTKDGSYRLTAWVNGEKRSAFISEDLYKSIGNTTGSMANDLEKGLLKIGNKLTGPMKTAITGINPNFAMRNISRDLPTAVINSVSGLAFPKYWAQAWYEMDHNSERWQQYQTLGGTHATYYNDNKGFADTMAKGDGLGSEIIGKIGWFNERTEAQTRFAEYLATIDRLGDTYENRLLGIKNSAEVTVDFSRKGRYGKVINAWVPYWNPAVQGIDKVVRSVVESPEGSSVLKQASKTLGRAVVTTVLFEAIQYVVLNALDRYEDWEWLTDRVKDTYYCIPVGKTHTFIKIPKNREWGAILGTPLMRLLEGANGRDDPFKNYAETSLEPNFLPGAILHFGGDRIESDIIGVSQALDLAYNKDFAGRTIVPYAYQQGSAEEQYDAETSALARKLGELLHFSPMQIDYIIEDYFGDFGDLFTMATSEATWSGDTTFEDTAQSVLDLLTNPWVADSRYSNQAVSDYYETLTELEKKVQDQKNHLGDAAKDTTEYKTKSAMDKLYGKQITELNRSLRDMADGEEKDDAKSQIALLARNALDFYDQAMSGTIKEPELTAAYAELPSVLSDELIRLNGMTQDYSFTPTDYKPSKYNDPRKSGYEYLLDDTQKAKYRELYDQVYSEIMLKTIGKDKYRKATDVKKAEMLEEARDNVTEETKDRFLDWLKDNYRSTKKAK